MQSIAVWFGQKTTGAGIAAILGALSAVATGSLTWHAAIPVLIAGIVGLVMPENASAASATHTLVADTETLISAYRMGLEHGATHGLPMASKADAQTRLEPVLVSGAAATDTSKVAA
ncbi:MAG: hypothetical protein KGL35_20330 [Bradyrhizobium sp.]|nr:hypothetical protein [Bradyrhizobium sp.]